MIEALKHAMLTASEFRAARRDLASLKRAFEPRPTRPAVPPGQEHCDRCFNDGTAVDPDGTVHGLTLGTDEAHDLIGHIERHAAEDGATVKATPFGGYTSGYGLVLTEGELEAEHPQAWLAWKMAQNEKRATARQCVSPAGCDTRYKALSRPEVHLPDYVATIESHIRYAAQVEASAAEIAGDLLVVLSREWADVAGPPPGPEPAAAVPFIPLPPGHPVWHPLGLLRPFDAPAVAPSKCPDPKAHLPAPRRGRPPARRYGRGH